MFTLSSSPVVHMPCVLFMNIVSLVEFMHPVFIACQVELSQVTRFSLLVCACSMRDVYCSSAMITSLCLVISVDLLPNCFSMVVASGL